MFIVSKFSVRAKIGKSGNREIGKSRSEIRDPRSEIRDPRSGARGQGSGVRGQGSGVRGQGSGVAGRCGRGEVGREGPSQPGTKGREPGVSVSDSLWKPQAERLRSRFSSQMERTAKSAGVRPLMRAACPRVCGRISFKRWEASGLSPEIWP